MMPVAAHASNGNGLSIQPATTLEEPDWLILQAECASNMLEQIVWLFERVSFMVESSLATVIIELYFRER